MLDARIAAFTHSGATYLLNILFDLDVPIYRGAFPAFWQRAPDGRLRIAAQERTDLGVWFPRLHDSDELAPRAGLRVQWSHAPPRFDDVPDRLVFLVRDPRDMALSALARVGQGLTIDEFLRRPLPAIDGGAFDLDPINEWALHAELSRACAPPERTLVVRFEDLKTRPVDETKRVLAFLDVTTVSEADLTRAVAGSAFDVVRAASERWYARHPELARGTWHAMRKGQVGEWKERLASSASLPVFAGLPARVMSSLGYPIDAPPIAAASPAFRSGIERACLAWCERLHGGQSTSASAQRALACLQAAARDLAPSPTSEACAQAALARASPDLRARVGGVARRARTALGRTRRALTAPAPAPQTNTAAWPVLDVDAFAARAACPACGSSASTPLPGALQNAVGARVFPAGPRRFTRTLREARALRTCSSCGLVWQSLVPKPETLLALYAAPDEYAPWTPDPTRLTWSRALRALDAVPRGRLLDVGANDGEFLSTLPSRWTRDALEPAGASIARVARIATVHRGFIDAGDAALPDGAFDVITMFDVAEHMADVARGLTNVARALRAGGTLLIETGDMGSRPARVFGSGWWYCDYIEHIVFFSEPSLRSALARAGLRVTSCTRVARTTEVDALSSRVDLARALLDARRAERLLARAPESVLLDNPTRCSYRDHLFVVAVKE